MSQIGIPQENILEPIGGDYPATTPAAAGKSAFALGQTLVDDANQQTGGRAVSDVTPIPDANAKGKEQPDEPKANIVHGDVVPSTAVDANGNRIVDSDIVFTSGTFGGAYDEKQTARTHAVDVNGHMHDMTILAKPKTGGPGTGYGAFSGGTPGGVVVAAKTIQALTFTAKAPGLQGNGVTIEYTDTETAGAEVIVVTGSAISVGMEAGASTANMILAALLASGKVMGLVSVVLSGTGTDFQVAVAPTNLIGGANTDSDGATGVGATKGSIPAIAASGARNHAAINVIARGVGQVIQ